MICGTCHGARAIQSPIGSPIPCPECYGTGITSCCEGACGGPGEVTNGPIPPESRNEPQDFREQLPRHCDTQVELLGMFEDVVSVVWWT